MASSFDQGADPELSVVVVIVSDTVTPRARVDHLLGCLDALSRQLDAPTFEVIVPHHARTDGLDTVWRRFPHVTLVAVDEPEAAPPRHGGREHHDILRSRGLATARGQVVALLEDHGRPDPTWCRAVVQAHQAPCAAVGGAIENGIDRPLNWAVYYCDFGRYQNPVPAGPSHFVSDANVAYKRAALQAVRPVWEHTFREPAVNAELERRGEILLLNPSVVVFQARERLRLRDSLRERLIWGRSYAAARTRSLPGTRRLTYAAASPVLPALLTTRMLGLAVSRRRSLRPFLRALPFILLLSASWSLGELLGYLTSATSDR